MLGLLKKLRRIDRICEDFFVRFDTIIDLNGPGSNRI